MSTLARVHLARQLIETTMTCVLTRSFLENVSIMQEGNSKQSSVSHMSSSPFQPHLVLKTLSCNISKAANIWLSSAKWGRDGKWFQSTRRMSRQWISLLQEHYMHLKHHLWDGKHMTTNMHMTLHLSFSCRLVQCKM